MTDREPTQGQSGRGKILNLLVKDCRSHEHRGCKCEPKNHEECWGVLSNELDTLIQPEIDKTRQGTLREVAKKMRVLEDWGQLNIRDFPLVTALVESCERGEMPEQSGTKEMR